MKIKGRRVNETQTPTARNPYQDLRCLAEMYEDAQKTRLATENRLRSGMTDDLPLTATLGAQQSIENDLGKYLVKCYRKVADPGIIAWQQNTRGVGEKALAHLLGVIGHPVHTVARRGEKDGDDWIIVEGEAFDRSVSQLWSYCGVGDASRKLRKGMTQDEAMAAGNPRAKTILIEHIAVKVIMAGGEHRYTVYDKRREKTAGREGWTAAHQNNDAKRILAKALLKELWIAAGGANAEPKPRFVTHRTAA